MSQADNASVEIENGLVSVANELLTNVDNQRFTFSEEIVSIRTTPRIMPNGIVTGTNLVSVGSGNDNVTTAAFTCNISGDLRTVAADTSVAIVRTIEATPFSKHSVVAYMDGATPTIKVIAGAGHATAHSTVRGANGGPPYIGVDEVEIGQIWTSSHTAAPITASEIHTGGSYEERANYPTFTYNPIGRGLDATATGEEEAFVKFSAALPLIHTAGVAKKIFADYEGVEFAELTDCDGFSPPTETISSSSTQVYQGTKSVATRSVDSGTFAQMLDDGVNDLILGASGTKRVFRFKPDKDKTAYILCVGSVSAKPEYPAAGLIKATVNFSSEYPSARFSG